MKQNKEEIARRFATYSYLSEETIKEAIAGDKEALLCIYEKYRGYVRFIINKTAKAEGIRLDKNMLEDFEQQVWQGIIEDIRKFKI